MELTRLYLDRPGEASAAPSASRDGRDGRAACEGRARRRRGRRPVGTGRGGIGRGGEVGENAVRGREFCFTCFIRTFRGFACVRLRGELTRPRRRRETIRDNSRPCTSRPRSKARLFPVLVTATYDASTVSKALQSFSLAIELERELAFTLLSACELRVSQGGGC